MCPAGVQSGKQSLKRQLRPFTTKVTVIASSQPHFGKVDHNVA
jgi:hypothetical protein